jgi:fused signal recognition particle receptor
VNGVGQDHLDRQTRLPLPKARQERSSRRRGHVPGGCGGTAQSLGGPSPLPDCHGKENGDPAAVCYDGAKYAKEHAIDLVIVDTAGRLQTKANLMAELSKMKRVIQKEIPSAPHETFLIIDATTGPKWGRTSQGLQRSQRYHGHRDHQDGWHFQRRHHSFDPRGTRRAGPLRGLGEKMDDLEEFDLDEYLHALLVGEKK